MGIQIKFNQTAIMAHFFCLGIFLGSAVVQAKPTRRHTFETALSANIYDLRWTKTEWNIDGGHSFYEQAPLWLIQLRTHFPKARVDYQFAERLAENAYKTAALRNTRGLCWAGVADTLNEVLGRFANYTKLPLDRLATFDATANDDVKTIDKLPTYNGGRSAAAFWQWTQSNPQQLCSLFGFVPVNELQEGFVAIYAPGECGFHSQFGHIEVIVGNQGCSDHCRPLRPDCRPATILAPVKGCDGLFLAQQDIRLVTNNVLHNTFTALGGNHPNHGGAQGTRARIRHF